MKETALLVNILLAGAWHEFVLFLGDLDLLGKWKYRRARKYYRRDVALGLDPPCPVYMDPRGRGTFRVHPDDIVISPKVKRQVRTIARMRDAGVFEKE